MQFKLSSLVAFVAVVATSAAANDSKVEAQGGRPACGNPAYAVPLYRSYQPRVFDHFYTTSAPEHQNALRNLGYTDEGITGYIFPRAQPHTVPLYRLYHRTATDHFYTTSAAERDNARDRLGYTVEGIAGYIYPDNACGGLPLFRMYNGGVVKDHFYTMNAAERDNAATNLGYAREGVTGFMFPY